MGNFKKLAQKRLFLPVFSMILVMLINVVYDIATGSAPLSFFMISIKNGVLYGRLIGKLMVHPEHQGNGLGSCLLQELEKNCPAPRLELFTSNKSLRNLCLYERNGYIRCAEKAVSPALTLIFLEKKPSHPASAQNPV